MCWRWWSGARGQQRLRDLPLPRPRPTILCGAARVGCRPRPGVSAEGIAYCARGVKDISSSVKDISSGAGGSAHRADLGVVSVWRVCARPVAPGARGLSPPQGRAVVGRAARRSAPRRTNKMKRYWTGARGMDSTFRQK
jgi:hypothetical protein